VHAFDVFHCGSSWGSWRLPCCTSMNRGMVTETSFGYNSSCHYRSASQPSSYFATTMPNAIISVFRVIRAALTPRKPAASLHDTAPAAPRQRVNDSETATSSGYSSPTVTSELSFPSREHSFVTVSSIHDDFVLISVSRVHSLTSS
jgi:hypothetical protein